MKSDRLAHTLIICIAAVVILIYLKTILVPLVFALIVWFLISELKQAMARMPYLGKRLPNWLQNIVAFTIIIGTIVLFGMLLTNSITRMINASGSYQQNVQHIVDAINGTFGIDLMNEFQAYSEKLNASVIAGRVVNSLSNVVSDTFLVIIYVLFLMAEESVIPKKLHHVYNTKERYESVRKVIDEIYNSLSRYITMKTLMSLITGIASYLALLLIGVDFPIFWASLIFMLNYIPTIGSLIATVFPALMALLQYAEFGPFFLVLVVVGAIQFIVGNVIEPKMMGDSLNISALVVLISLAFWGSIWGVVGMFLSVPISVMLIIIFSRFKSTRSVAIWLSANGKVHS